MTCRLAQCAVLALFVVAAVSCAAARPEDVRAIKGAPAGGAGGTISSGGPSAGGSGVAGGDRPSPAAGAAAGSGGGSQCWGPGLYSFGKGSPRLPCCAPYHEYYVDVAGRDMNDRRVCVPPIEGSVGCISGACGDGTCEVGEDVACGCAADCPKAVWEGTSSQAAVAPDVSNGFSEVPASCSKPDLLARLQTSPDAIRCGDLSYQATTDELVEAFECVNKAYQSNLPFELLWETAGTDSINPNGLVGRLRNGVLEFFTLQVYTGNEFGLGLQGSTALWRRCPLTISGCEAGNLDECLSCTSARDAVTCECLPEGKRPNAPDGKMVELRCGREDA